MRGLGELCFLLRPEIYDGQNLMVSPAVRSWVEKVVVRKTIRVWEKHSPNCDFLLLHSPSTLSTSINNMTGGSSVRGKADPIWVRKVFNCLRSL
jgi:hypothetical protein